MIQEKTKDLELKKPLEGITVLDLTQAYSGPFCTMHLADQGATVIKIEMPGVGDQSRYWTPIKNDASAYYGYINRNKYGMTLNLKKEKGKEIFKKLVAKADVVCENYRVGTMEKLGLSYEVLKEINPKLIYASISGYGLEGELATQPCYDVVAQAMGGMMSLTGFPGQQVKVGASIIDNYSGTYLSLGICMALYQRQQTGLGRRIDVSMIDTTFSILESAVVEYTVNHKIPEPIGNNDHGIAPFGAFKASDGQFVMGCGNNRFFEKLCNIMQQPEMCNDPKYCDNEKRCDHVEELEQWINQWAADYKVADIEKMCQEAGIPFGRIQNIKEIAESDLIRSRNMLWKVHDHGMDMDIEIPGTPIKMHGCEDKIQKSAPTLGEDNQKILSDLLQLDEKEIEEILQSDVM